MTMGLTGTLPRETSSGKPPTPQFQKQSRPSVLQCNVSSHFCQSLANVTGDSALVQHDSPPVTLGSAGSYDNFRVTLGSGWLIMQAFRRQNRGALSWRPIPDAAQEATATLPCLTTLLTKKEQLFINVPVALFSTS